MDLDGVKIQNYLYHFLREMDDLYSLANKDIMFLFYDPDINNAKALLKMGANKVYFVNPEYDYEEIEDGKIVLVNLDAFKLDKIKSESVDLICGLEILEHINNLKVFFDEIKRIIKPSGDIELHGSPMWTCHFGHHLWIENKYIFYEESNPFEPWEHLLYDSQEDMKNALVQKGLPEYDCSEIVRWIYDPVEISRHSPSEIIEAATGVPAGAEKGAISKSSSALFETYKKDSWLYIFKRYYDRTEINEHFNSAMSKYSENDLKTFKLVLKMKKLKEESSSPQKIVLPEMTSDIEDIIVPFNNKYNVANLNVLNLSGYQSELITKVFMAFGAKSVTSISPTLVNESCEYDGNVKAYKMYFEDFDIENCKFDIVFGINALNNISNINTFCAKLKKVTDITAGIYLSGFMPYTSPCGHLIYTDDHRFIDETNPLEYWQHISIPNREAFEKVLQDKNMKPNEIKYILDTYYDKLSVVKLSPTEIEEKFKSYMNLHMYRIYKYLPKNEYYEKALQKYSEDDLNIERIIISSDFPILYWLDELDLDEYLQSSLSDINLKYKLAGKRVLNISPYINYMITDGLESLRAAEVVSLSSHYSGYELRGGKNARRVNQDIEDLENLTGKFDIIYGLDVLEHVKDVKKFYENLRDLVKDDGIICLQGSPLWPSDNGHNCTLALDCGILKTGEGSPCLEPWEHLGYDSKQELKEAMIKKNFTENDAQKVSDFIFDSNEINRKSYVDFIDILNEVEGVYYGSKKILHYSEENEFYQKANEKYTHEELRTKELKLYIRKKLS